MLFLHLMSGIKNIYIYNVLNMYLTYSEEKNQDDNVPLPKTSYLYSFTLWIYVLNTALYSFNKTRFILEKSVC